MTREEEFAQWLEGRPESVRALALAYPPTCYLSTENSGHYHVVAYSEEGTLRLAHGADSYKPGFGVFGVDPKTLIKCDCGKWEFPTKSQQRLSEKRVKAWMERRKNSPESE